MSIEGFENIGSTFEYAVRHNNLKVVKWYLKHYSLEKKLVVSFENLCQDMRQWLLKNGFFESVIVFSIPCASNFNLNEAIERNLMTF